MQKQTTRLFLILLMPMCYVTNGWATSVLWKLFVSPVFNLPNLSLVQAIGITLFWGFLSCSPGTIDGIDNLQEKLIPYYDKKERALSNLVKNGIILPLFVVGIGYCFAYFL